MALSQTPLNATQLSFNRQKYLFACLKSAKLWLETFFSFSALEYLRFPFSIASQMVHCIGTLFYLSTLDEPGWDKEHARAVVDVVQVMDRVLQELERAIPLLPTDEEDNVFRRHYTMWTSIRPTWVAKLNGQEPQANNMIDPTGATNDFAFGELFDLDFFDSEWLASMN